MKRRPIEERLQSLEGRYAPTGQLSFDLTRLTDDELAELEHAVLTGEVTARALAIAEKAWRKPGSKTDPR